MKRETPDEFRARMRACIADYEERLKGVLDQRVIDDLEDMTESFWVATLAQSRPERGPVRRRLTGRDIILKRERAISRAARHRVEIK